MISKLHHQQHQHQQAGAAETKTEPQPQPHQKGYSLRELCRLFKVNRAWYYARQKLAQPRQEVEASLKTFVEKLLKDQTGWGQTGDQGFAKSWL
jgi:hypothetical protein